MRRTRVRNSAEQLKKAARTRALQMQPWLSGSVGRLARLAGLETSESGKKSSSSGKFVLMRMSCRLARPRQPSVYLEIVGPPF